MPVKVCWTIIQQGIHGFTCCVVNRVEADSKSPDFVWVIAFDAPSCTLNPCPVVISERCVVVGIESRTFAKTNESILNISDSGLEIKMRLETESTIIWEVVPVTLKIKC